MTDEGLDEKIAFSLKADASRLRLPADFAERLRTHLRRSRRRRKLTVAALSLVAALFAIIAVSRIGCDGSRERAEVALRAARETPKSAQDSSRWMLIGMFRECFRRLKGAKKEEETE